MFVSKRALVLVVSILGIAGIAACGSDGSEGEANGDLHATNGGGENGAATGATSSTSSTSSSSSSGSSTEPGASSSGGSSSGGSSSGGSSSGGSSSGAPAQAVSWECARCSAFAASEAGPGTLKYWEMCDGEYHWGKGTEPKSAALYTEYLGCLCSGPCVNECETTLCALVPSAASPSCKSCLALDNAACSTSKSACMADVAAQ